MMDIYILYIVHLSCSYAVQIQPDPILIEIEISALSKAKVTLPACTHHVHHNTHTIEKSLTAICPVACGFVIGRVDTCEFQFVSVCQVT